MAAISARACSIRTLVLSRASATYAPGPRCAIASDVSAAGIQICARPGMYSNVWRKSSLSTPTMTCGLSSSVIFCPITFGDEPKRVAQY